MPNNHDQPENLSDPEIRPEQPRPMYAVCADHLERALEEYVDELLRAPDVYLADDASAAEAAGGRTIPTTCQFCGERAKYLVI